MTKEERLYEQWRERAGKDDPAYAAELDGIQGDRDEIYDRFWCDLNFGTAGLRGVLGLGTNRMNVYTVRRATQGLAAYLLKRTDKPSAAIAYDSRNGSVLFAQEAARVLAANGVKVHLYAELMPTPALSYAVRKLKCDAGIVVTASHNPAKYNGYKVYGPDGCQIGPETAAAVYEIIMSTDIFDGVKLTGFETALAQGLVNYIPDSFVGQYIDRVCRESLNPAAVGKAGLKLVYTPLNGAGRRCVLRVLEKLGMRDITVVPEQENPDGNFPTCPFPNPEMREALELGLKLAQEKGADMLLATDPDADRVAVAVRGKDGNFRILSGNEAGVLLLDYIARTRRAQGKMPKEPVAVKSIVSSKLADAVAAEHGVEMRSVLTGFKFIGEVIASLEEKGEADRFIFGFEESCGYLSGGYVRDKDAIDASMLLVEMASYYKLEGKSLLDVLDDLYSRHGIHASIVSNLAFEGAGGMKRMIAIMHRLREKPPKEIAGVAVLAHTDYLSSICVRGGCEIKIPLPASNVLEYEMCDGNTVMIRPSGTEPKIKVYYSFRAGTQAEIDALARKYQQACEALIV